MRNIAAITALLVVLPALWGQTPDGVDSERIFRRNDTDQDGFLSKAELEAMLIKAPALKNARPERLDSIFRRADDDGDDKISLDEYKKMVSRRKIGFDAPASRPTTEPTMPAAEPQKFATDPEGLEFFEMKIRPILATQCYQCHSARAEELRGGLALDTWEGLQKGGSSGPVVIPGDPDNSPLVSALHWNDESLRMPPKQKLPDFVVDDFAAWVKRGAPHAGALTSHAPVKSGVDIEAGRNWWSFLPPEKSQTPAIEDSAWVETDIDRFLLAAMEKDGLEPVGDADPYTLVRRIFFDLLGLPPTPLDIEAFVKQCKKSGSRWDIPKDAISSLVDRLLASPHYGERWGRHWLDVARYAETSGKTTNFNYPHAWRYRDWVIDAFNKDMAYDQFVRMQIAGDLLPAQYERERAQNLIATGFLAIGPKGLNERNREQFAADLVDEQIDAVTQGFLGLTVACARCHDHKYDPIPQTDYYAMAGIFRSTETCYGTTRVIQNVHPSPLIELSPNSEQPAAIEAKLAMDIQDMQREAVRLREEIAELRAEPGDNRTLRLRTQLAVLEARIKEYRPDGTPRIFAMAVRERSRPMNAAFLARGEIDKAGDPVPRGVVQVVTREIPAIKNGSGRRELAEWIASPTNPLTARVMVNRVWMQLFGRGIVPTCDNFGAAGMEPSNKELLDHLAVEFVRSQWSVKTLVKKMMLSHAYRMASTHHAENFEKDPDNVRVWRMSKKRLDAEAIRDAMLAISGELEKKPYFGSAVAEAGEGPSRGLERANNLEVAFTHRAVYLPVLRSTLVESLALFDFPDPNVVQSDRPTTSVPSQALYLLNDDFVMRRSFAAGDRLGAGDAKAREKIAAAFLAIFNRPATPFESDLSQRFLEDYVKTLRKDGGKNEMIRREAWAAFIQGLFAGADFLFLS